jgi:hypothetical protein
MSCASLCMMFTPQTLGLAFERSAQSFRTVRPVLANCPPLAQGQSAPPLRTVASARQLHPSYLPLVLCFRFLIHGLSLGLVGLCMPS